MTYDSLEDLPVWQDAIKLAGIVDDFTRANTKVLTFSQRDQIERASLFISNNIAECFEKKTTPDLINYLFIAKGSAGEVRSITQFFQTRNYLSHTAGIEASMFWK
jgi:four helix bundle protein